MGSALCCGGSNTTTVLKKDNEASLTANRNPQNPQIMKQEGRRQAEAGQLLQGPVPFQNNVSAVVNRRDLQPSGLNQMLMNHSAPIRPNEQPHQLPQAQLQNEDLSIESGESEEDISMSQMQNLVMNRMAINDPYLRQILEQLIGNRRLENHEHIDVFDPQAMQKLQKLNLPEDGLLPYQIDSIIPYKYTRSTKDPAAVECNICLVDFEDGNMVKRLQCLHLYHQKCIDEWLAKRSVCPDCKFNIRALDMDQLI